MMLETTLRLTVKGELHTVHVFYEKDDNKLLIDAIEFQNIWPPKMIDYYELPLSDQMAIYQRLEQEVLS